MSASLIVKASVKRAEIHTHPLLSIYSMLFHTSLNCPNVTEHLNSRQSLARFHDKNNFPERVRYLCSLALRQNGFFFTRTYRIRDGSNWDGNFSYLKSHLKSAATFLLCNCSTERWVWTASPLSFSLLSPSTSRTVQNKWSLLFHKAHRTRTLPLNPTPDINVWKWQEGR